MSYITAGIAAAGLATSVAGTFLRNQGVSEGNAAAFGPGGPLDAERLRQGNFTKEAQEALAREMARYDDFSGQMGGAAQRASDFFRANSSTLPASGPTAGTVPTSTSSAVVNDAVGKNAKVAAFNGQQNGALAGLRSFGDTMGDINRGLGIDRQHLANIGSFRHGSEAIVPLEMQAAGYAGAGTQQLGDMVGGVGRIGTLAALSGAGRNWFGNGSVTTGPKPGLSWAEALNTGVTPP